MVCLFWLWPSPAAGEGLEGFETPLRERLVAAFRDDGLFLRKGGDAYAVDHATMMLYAVRSGRRELFGDLASALEERFCVRSDAGDCQVVTVCWRVRPGTPPDASGTTETFLAAAAYWRAYRVWKVPVYGERAVSLLRGYLWHQWKSGGHWMIRNYYNYSEEAFATNSFTMGYAPDLLREVGETLESSEFADVADWSLGFVLAAQTEWGLFHSVFDPEMKSLYAVCMDSPHYSPNNLAKPGDSAAIALEITGSAPDAARRVLSFIKSRWPSVANAYSLTTGAPAQGKACGGGMAYGHWAQVLRLAAALEDGLFASMVAERLAAGLDAESLSVWDSAQLLLAIEESRAIPAEEKRR
ncbi:MAG: hypothetical protein K9L28_11060 [Synergistales bacterium]|nr:hypothetical protein [Synergistales bacterium]